MLILIPAASHLSANQSSECWNSQTDGTNRTISRSNDTILSPLTCNPASPQLRLKSLSLKITNRVGDKAQPCHLAPLHFESALSCRQLAQNTAALSLINTNRWSHITRILASLHRLPVKCRIHFKYYSSHTRPYMALPLLSYLIFCFSTPPLDHSDVLNKVCYLYPSLTANSEATVLLLSGHHPSETVSTPLLDKLCLSMFLKNFLKLISTGSTSPSRGYKNITLYYCFICCSFFLHEYFFVILFTALYVCFICICTGWPTPGWEPLLYSTLF